TRQPRAGLIVGATGARSRSLGMRMGTRFKLRTRPRLAPTGPPCAGGQIGAHIGNIAICVGDQGSASVGPFAFPPFGTACRSAQVRTGPGFRLGRSVTKAQSYRSALLVFVVTVLPGRGLLGLVLTTATLSALAFAFLVVLAAAIVVLVIRHRI